MTLNNLQTVFHRISCCYSSSKKLYSILAINNKVSLPNLIKQLPILEVGRHANMWAMHATNSLKNALSIVLTIVANAFMDTHPSYFVFGFGISIFAIILWISLKYPFWNTQPVYHTYDFWRGIYSEPYIIQKIPNKTRYYDKTGAIKTVCWSRLTRDNIINMLNLVNRCFIPSDRILLDIQENEWTALFDDDTYVSFSGETTNFQGICTTRPILSRIGQTNFALNYLDYLTLERTGNSDSKPKQSLFSTHEYNVRIYNTTSGSGHKPLLLKHESGEYIGVVPFIRYNLVHYHLNKLAPWALPVMPSHIQLVSCVEINGVGKKRKYENTDVLNDFAKSFLELPMFEVKIWPGLPAIMRQFSAGSLHMFALRKYGEVLAVYFMRNARTYYEELDGVNTLECVATVSMLDTKDADLFYAGFLLAIREMMKDTQQNYGVLSVAGIGHNVLLNDRLPKNDVILSVKSEYVLHNMVAPKSPYSPESVSIII